MGGAAQPAERYRPSEDRSERVIDLNAVGAVKIRNDCRNIRGYPAPRRGDHQ